MSSMPPAIATPSTTTSGLLLATSERTPRMRMSGESPGLYEFVSMSTPAMRPFNASPTLGVGISCSSSAFTEATAPVTSCLRAVPYPTATTCSSCTTCVTSWKLTAADCPAATVTDFVCSAKPILLAFTWCAPAGTSVMVKRPSAPDSAPRVVPCTNRIGFKHP